MAAYNFPDTTGQLTDGSFTYTAPTGEIYSWNGYSWVTAASSEAGTYVKKAGDSMSGDLEINAKASSLATERTDPDNTLATKSYVDTNVSTAGVSSIVAGNGISVNQSTGDVTITNTGGGGGGGGGDSSVTPQKVAILADVKPTGTTGGTSVAGWQDRTLNTIQSDTGNLVTLANDKEFTLKAGTYLIEWSAPAWKPAIHKTRLTNVTDGTPQAIGSNAYNNPADFVQTSSGGSTRVSITSDTTYKIEHYCEVGSGDGLGTANSTGENEIYTQVTITDLAIVGGSGTVANTNIYGTAKAWADVDVSGINDGAQGTLSGSYNIASCTRNGTSYDFLFSQPLQDGNYSVVSNSANGPTTFNGLSKSDTGFTINVRDSSGVGVLATKITVAVFDEEPAEVALTTFGDVINYSGAAAWGDVAADGTLANGLNIASVTRTGTGTYTVTFQTPLPSSAYSITTGGNAFNVMVRSQDANGFEVTTYNTSGSGSNKDFNFAVHALNALPPKGGTGTDAWAACAQGGAIEGSFNIASVTKVSTGIYDVLFTTPMPTVKYSVVGSVGFPSKTGGGFAVLGNKRVDGFRAQLVTPAEAEFDYAFNFAVNATNAKLPNSFTEEELQTILDLAQSGVTNPGASAWGDISELGVIEGGLNIASVTKTGLGSFEVVFQTPMPNAYYAINATPNFTGVAGGWFCQVYNKTAQGCNIKVVNYNNQEGQEDFSFTVFATNALPLKGGTGTDSWGSVLEDGTLESSFNVASVTNTGAGLYEIVFTTPMPTATYAVTLGGVTLSQFSGQVELRSTTGFKVVTRNAAQSTKTNRGFSFAVNATNATLPSTITQEEADLIIDTIKGAGVAQKVAILADVKSNGTNGGASVVGWQDRTLNTIQSDEGNLVTLANDKEFTLKPGTYLIEWSAPAYIVDRHQTKLTNVTTGLLEKIGTSEFSYQTDNVQSRSFGSVRINISSDTTYKIEHHCEYSRVANGLGVESSSGEEETYTQVTITDLAVLAAGGGSGGGGSTDIYGTAKAWAQLAADGTLLSGSGLSCVRTGKGNYQLTFDKPRSNTDYVVTASAGVVNMLVKNKTTTGFLASTRLASDGTVTADIPCDVAVFDDEPITVSGGGSGGGGTTKADIYGTAKAWGYFEGVSSNATAVPINGSSNVASITRNGKGLYDVVFTTPMANDNYSVSVSSSSASVSVKAAITAAGFTIDFRTTNNEANDPSFGWFQVFDDEPAEIIVGSGTVANTNLYGTAKAWGAFSASAFLEGFNFDVNSFSKNSVGSYTLTFVEPMSSDQYSVTATSNSNSGRLINIINKTATSFDVRSRSITTDNLTDGDFNLAVHDNQPAEVALTTFGDVINYNGASAWGRGEGDGTLLNGLNIASVTRVSAGVYDVVFTTPMPDSNYAVNVSTSSSNLRIEISINQTPAGFTFELMSTSGARGDAEWSFTVHALNALPPKGGTGTDSWATVDETTSNGACNVPASFNVASVTRTAKGKYDVVFTTPMPTNSYSVVGSVLYDSSSSTRQINIASTSTTGYSLTIWSFNGSNWVAQDTAFSVVVNATNATLPSTFTAEQIQSILDVIDGGLGVGVPSQSWQDVKSSRTTGTAYTNDTGNAIQVQVSPVAGGSLIGTFLVDGVEIALAQATPAGGGGSVGFSVIVPNGSTYQVNNVGNYIISHWFELRA